MSLRLEDLPPEEQERIREFMEPTEGERLYLEATRQRVEDAMRLLPENQCHEFGPPEPAKVEPMEKSVMSWICANGHRVVFWRNTCTECGAHAAGFQGSTYGVGFPD